MYVVKTNAHGALLEAKLLELLSQGGLSCLLPSYMEAHGMNVATTILNNGAGTQQYSRVTLLGVLVEAALKRVDSLITDDGKINLANDRLISELSNMRKGYSSTMQIAAILQHGFEDGGIVREDGDNSLSALVSRLLEATLMDVSTGQTVGSEESRQILREVVSALQTMSAGITWAADLMFTVPVINQISALRNVEQMSPGSTRENPLTLVRHFSTLYDFNFLNEVAWDGEVISDENAISGGAVSVIPRVYTEKEVCKIYTMLEVLRRFHDLESIEREFQAHAQIGAKMRQDRVNASEVTFIVDNLRKVHFEQYLASCYLPVIFATLRRLYDSTGVTYLAHHHSDVLSFKASELGVKWIKAVTSASLGDPVLEANSSYYIDTDRRPVLTIFGEYRNFDKRVSDLLNRTQSMMSKIHFVEALFPAVAREPRIYSPDMHPVDLDHGIGLRYRLLDRSLLLLGYFNGSSDQELHVITPAAYERLVATGKKPGKQAPSLTVPVFRNVIGQAYVAVPSARPTGVGSGPWYVFSGENTTHVTNLSRIMHDLWSYWSLSTVPFRCGTIISAMQSLAPTPIQVLSPVITNYPISSISGWWYTAKDAGISSQRTTRAYVAVNDSGIEAVELTGDSLILSAGDRDISVVNARSLPRMTEVFGVKGGAQIPVFYAKDPGFVSARLGAVVKPQQWYESTVYLLVQSMVLLGELSALDNDQADSYDMFVSGIDDGSNMANRFGAVNMFFGDLIVN